MCRQVDSSYSLKYFPYLMNIEFPMKILHSREIASFLLQVLVSCLNVVVIPNLVDNAVYRGFDHFQPEWYCQMLFAETAPVHTTMITINILGWLV